MSERQNFTFVIAPNYIWFRRWCALDNDPPENPRDPKFLVFTDGSRPIGRGRRAIEGDRCIVLNERDIQWMNWHLVLDELVSIYGFRADQIEWIET